MPKAIILYEIDQSFGPNILAEYYLKQDDKIPSNILKEFLEKHVDKKYSEVTIRDESNRYYSHIVDTASIDKEDLYLGFILQEGEDLLSLKSIFKNIEEKVIQEFSDDKKKMIEILKDGLNSILGGKGTGKSVLIELMRFCLNQSPVHPDILRDHSGKLQARLAAL